MLSAFDKIKAVIPNVTPLNFKHYKFWKEHQDILEEMLNHLYLTPSKNESEVQALKRLGKIDFLIDLKNSIRIYDDILRREPNA